MRARPSSRIGAPRNGSRRSRAPTSSFPIETVDDKRTIKLGGTTLELRLLGRNHSDSSLVMLLPKEKIIFAVDFNSLGAVPSRLAVNDSYPIEWEASLKRTLALDWDRMIPGHPGPGGRLGTKKDMEQQLAFMTDLSAEVKKASDAGKCFDPAADRRCSCRSMRRCKATSRTSNGTCTAGAAIGAAASDWSTLLFPLTRRHARILLHRASDVGGKRA